MMDLGDVLRLGQPAEAEPPPNDIDATGRCCCGGCIGMGPPQPTKGTAMPKEDLINDLLTFLKQHENVESANRIDGEDAVGVELTDGSEYFIEIQPV